MLLRILSGKGAVQIIPFRKVGGKCHFLLRFCTRKRSETYVLNVVDNRRYQNVIMLYISVYVVKLLNRDTACQVLYLVTLILSGFLKDVELCFYSAKGSFRNSCLHRRHSSQKRNKGTKFRKILKRRFYFKLYLSQS